VSIGEKELTMAPEDIL